MEKLNISSEKVLVVYYSLEGHCARVADYLARQFGFHVLGLQPIKDFDPKGTTKHWLGRFQVLFNQAVPLAPLPETLNHYEMIILGTPVWMGSYAPAIQTFLDEVSLEHASIAIYTTYEKDAGDVFLRLQERLPATQIAGEISMSTRDFEDDAYQLRIDNWLYSLFQ